jgi:hypothetical protein
MPSKSTKSAKPQLSIPSESKSKKSVAKTLGPQPHSKPAAPQAPQSGRERRPSDKVATQRKFILYPFTQK